MSVKHAISVMIAFTLTYLSVNAQIQYNSSDERNDAGMGVKRVARFFTAAYESKSAKSDDEIRWVQIDLGEKKKIDGVKILPKIVPWGYAQSEGFPAHECYALENGPVLMAYVSHNANEGNLKMSVSRERLLKSLKQVAGRPLHYYINGNKDFEYMP